MSEKEFERKVKGEQPVLAICYDFDKTLSPDNMQAQGYIQSVGYPDPDKFWEESNKLAEENDMDQNLAYMFKMKEEAYGKLVFNKKKLIEAGEKVTFYEGVEDWFQRINEYGAENGIIVEHYVISSGLKEMIDGTRIAKEFEKIYASSFYYDGKGVAIWPAQVVNYTSKTQFLFRIEKGVLDINDSGVNEFISADKIRVPFRNILYIGDSDTDIPCMKLVNSYGGHSIGVYDPNISDRTKVYKMLKENRIKYFAAANYTEGSELDDLVKLIIRRTAENEQLEKKHFECMDEMTKYQDGRSDEERKKENLIIALENSDSFKRTHEIISKLNNYNFEFKEKVLLCNTILTNMQVRYIVADCDVKEFFTKLISDINVDNDVIKEVREILG